MVKTSFKATHNWPEASQFAGENVKFLETEHRHTFHVKASLRVTDEDMEVEFFVFQGQVNDAIESLYSDNRTELVYRLGRRSCETIATEIIEELRITHNYTHGMKMEVWEDEEVGAEVTEE